MADTSTPGQSPQQASSATTGQAPSLLRHLVAMIYDLFLVVAVVFVVNGLALGVQVKIMGSEQHALHPQASLLLILASVYGFFTLFWIKQGQTLGMQAWRIRLQDAQGNLPGAGRCLLRCCAATLSFACLGLGYLWALVDRRNRYWHDHLSGTRLVLLPKNSRDADTAPQV